MKNNSSSLAPVCILTAGRGTRMGILASVINKSLLPYKGKALITHIIEQFPPQTPFVIATGYEAQQVRNYIANAHPDLQVSYVDVDNFAGDGSGPGHSLWCCREYLNQAFYFVACDTYFSINSSPPVTTNWIGTSCINQNARANYCNVLVNGKIVTQLLDKQACDSQSCQTFSGLMYIYDYALFWESLSKDECIAGEKQISTGLKEIISKSTLYAQEISWLDLGDYAKYRQAVENSEAYDFSKTNEFLYFVNQRVIKFFSDKEIVSRRVAKAALNRKVFPDIELSKDNWYSYKFIAGRTLYAHNHPALFNDLLLWLDKNLWQPKSNVDEQHMQNLCIQFYQKKTLARINDYNKKYPSPNNYPIVNGREISGIEQILNDIPWETLKLGIPTFMHGDLQFDNIIYDEDTKEFCLLDWRQDFAGEIEYGDIYYDLAKLLGGIILNYDYIKAGLCTVKLIGDEIQFDFPQRFTGIYFIKTLKKFINAKDLDFKRVTILVGLIYLNMAPLHHPPFDQALHALGRTILHDALYTNANTLMHSTQALQAAYEC